jgi:hypothetical protein
LTGGRKASHKPAGPVASDKASSGSRALDRARASKTCPRRNYAGHHWANNYGSTDKARWTGRFALEARGADLQAIQTAAAALDALPDAPAEAMETLAGLCAAYAIS